MTSATNHATLSRTTSACSLPISLSTNSTAVILPFSAIVVLLHPSICERTDDSEAHGGRPTLRPGQASPLHHFYRLDRLHRRLDASKVLALIQLRRFVTGCSAVARFAWLDRSCDAVPVGQTVVR